MTIDFDNSGQVSFPEFVADYNRVLDTPLSNLIADEKAKARTNQMMDDINYDTKDSLSMEQRNVISLKTKLEQ